jgi:hypothetical protein
MMRNINVEIVAFRLNKESGAGARKKIRCKNPLRFIERDIPGVVNSGVTHEPTRSSSEY